MLKKNGMKGMGIAVLTAAIVIAGITGCQEKKEAEQISTQENESADYVSTQYLADSIKEKYEETSKYTFGETIVLTDRGQSFELDIAFDPYEAGIERWEEICSIFQDPELQDLVVPNFTYDKEAKKIIVAPTKYPIGLVSTYGLDTDELSRYPHGGNELFPRNQGNDWGNLGTMYLAIYRDLETGEKLDKPLVRIITIEGEIKESPIVEFRVTEDGRPVFSWEPVEGAKEYVICKVSYRAEGENSITGMSGLATPIVITSETSWIGEAPEYDDVNMNKEFRYHSLSEDDWKDEVMLESYKTLYEEEGKVYRSKYSDYEYCVIALNENGTSMMSNTFSLKDMAANLPYCYAISTAIENGTNQKQRESVGDMPVYQYITMCDGYTAEKLIDYKTEDAKVIVERWAFTDEDTTLIEMRDITVLRIPCIIEGTAFEREMVVLEYDEANLKEDLAFLEEREESVRKKAGDISISSNLNYKDSEEDEEQIRDILDIPVTANSALSEYLARNMLAGVTNIDLSLFPEAASQKILEDAWAEAYYQNPLILGVQGYRVNITHTRMRIVYDDVDALPAKQQELLAMIPQIVDSIITEEMTDLEKEFAINEYLCETIVYDDAALEDAKSNDFKAVDAKFNDSFTAYGALINGKCVCAGYAAAFKLLAQEAGLDSLVVTGLLEGNLNHAWNKVKIGEDWQVVDVTNNDTEYLSNALLNLSNDAGDKVLIEDKEYVLDGVLDDYVANNDENEYYRVKERYFSYEEIAEQLVDELKKDGKALLRTEYELDDEVFYSITDAIYEQMDESVRLKGFYWMGVIYLEIKK